MNDPFVIFWSILLFASVGWYGFLVYLIGRKAGREIRTQTQSLGSDKPSAKSETPAGDNRPSSEP